MSDETTCEMYLAASRVAGELHGRLNELLGFGELTTTIHTEQSYSRVLFRWRFPTSGGYYVDQVYMTASELSTHQAEELAINISDKWRKNHAKTMLEHGTSGGVE